MGSVTRAINDVNRNLQAVDARVATVAGQVVAVADTQEKTRSELDALRADFLRFIKQSELTANVQLAQTRVGNLADQLDHEFGSHKEVRDTAVGMLQAFDVGLVTHETVDTVSQELMLRTPRYWLAPALVALARWAADDREQAERALGEAFRRSPEKTSLFFALVLRRQGRQEAAVRWIRHYLLAQDPAALGREFAVVLECVSQGAFGPGAMDLVQDTLERWREQLLTDEAVKLAQVQRWRAELDGLQGPPSAGEFPRLAQVSPQWSQLEAALRGAEGHRNVLDKYRAMLAEELRPSSQIEDAVDDILDQLVKEYDLDELPLRRSLAHQQAIIDADGDVEAARQNTDADSASYDVTLDYLTVQTTSALNPAAIGVSRATQRLAVATCHDWLERAHEGYTAGYRAQVPQDVEAVFETTHSFGAQRFQLPRWTGSFATPVDELERSLTSHWDRHAQPFLDSLVYRWTKDALIGGGIALLAFILTYQMSIGFALLLLAGIGGYWAFRIHSRQQAAEKNLAEARRVLEEAKHDSVTQLRGAAAELTDWQSRYLRANAQEREVGVLIRELATARTAARPFEVRTVDAAHQQEAR